MTFVPAPSDILRSESGGRSNVGYDGIDRKRLDTMARSRLRRWGGTRTARNHDVRATRQGEDARSERSESKAGAVFDGRDKTQARQGAESPARQQGRRRRRSIATRIVDERRKSDRLMSGRERREAEPPRSQVENAKRGKGRQFGCRASDTVLNPLTHYGGCGNWREDLV